jgi:predicted ATP-binding protein involved in virulence
MRVSKIFVKRLFNTFDHSIPLNLDGRVTIIHGLNGLGKTTLLKMVKSLCTARFYELQSIPFAELRLDFDDESSIVVERTDDSPEESPQTRKRQGLVIRYLMQGVEQEFYKPSARLDLRSFGIHLEWLEAHVTGLSRVAERKWRYLPTRESLSLEQVLDRFGGLFPEGLTPVKDVPSWVKKLNTSIRVRLIETQRLVTPRTSVRHREYEADSPLTPAIEMHSEELATKIGKQESEYGALSQSLDRTFPMRYVQQKTKISMSDDELRTRFQNLESKRARLEEAGLLEKEKTGFELPSHMDEATRGVMSVYVTDTEQKLSVFDDLAARIDLFRQIINDHFMYKQLQVSKKKGFRFLSTRTGEELDSPDLSSGEQHEVVLLYELLFHVAKNSLIMIDEPEISLHIAWQEEFLRDLQQIIKLSPFDAVIATHSPQIVNDRWDLTVELTGPEESER